MKRYFFNVFAGSDSYDDEGTFFEDDDEAHIHMVEIARKLIEQRQKSADDLWSGSIWTLAIRDENGKSIATIVFNAQG